MNFVCKDASLRSMTKKWEDDLVGSTDGVAVAAAHTAYQDIDAQRHLPHGGFFHTAVFHRAELFQGDKKVVAMDAVLLCSEIPRSTVAALYNLKVEFNRWSFSCAGLLRHPHKNRAGCQREQNPALARRQLPPHCFFSLLARSV